MIIFYDLKTGDITGTIEGRVHDEMHQKMFVGDPKTTGKIVCEWKPIGKETITLVDEPVYSKVLNSDNTITVVQTGTQQREVVNTEYLPELQSDVFTSLDSHKTRPSDYIVDVKTKKLKLKKQ